MVLTLSMHAAVASAAVSIGRQGGGVPVICGAMHATAASYAAVRFAVLAAPSNCMHAKMSHICS